MRSLTLAFQWAGNYLDKLLNVAEEYDYLSLYIYTNRQIHEDNAQNF